MTIGKTLLNSSSKETSILKTANLMKESVLLSPTFSALKAYEVLNAEDINNFNDSEKNIEDNQFLLKNVKEDPQNNNFEFLEIADENINNNHVNDMKRSNNDIILNVDYETDISKPNDKLSNTFILSENSEFLSDKPTKNFNPKTQLESKNKINILSQEILDAEKIKQLNFFHAPEACNLIPVKIDTTLSKSNNTNSTEKIFVKRIESQNSEQNISNGVNQIVSLNMDHKKTSEVGEHELIHKSNVSSYHFVNISCLQEEFKDKNHFTSVNGKDQNCLRNLGSSNLSSMQEPCKLNLQNDTLHISNSQDQQLTHNSENATNKSKFSLPKQTENIEDINHADTSFNFNYAEDCKEKRFTSEENIVTSKLCIQGVEKPGGDLTVIWLNNKIPNPKTYSNTKKPKSYKSKVKYLENSYEKNVDIDCKIRKPKEVTSNFPIFCICKDFGSLNYYESDKSYEHIHFLNKANAQCSLDILLTIYEDEYSAQEFTKEEKCFKYFDGLTEENLMAEECFNNNICWYHVENIYKNTDFDKNILSTKCDKFETITSGKSSTKLENDEIDLDAKPSIHKGCLEIKNKRSENTKQCEPSKQSSKESYCRKIETSTHEKTSKTAEEQTLRTTGELTLRTTEEQTSGTTEELTSRTTEEKIPVKTMICNQESNKNASKKRKRSSTNQLNNDKNSAQKVNETIRCEPCGDIVEKTEWENHIETKHCFIAWTEGQTINFEDIKLLLKLNRRLCDTGQLMCTFCDAEQNDLKKFINHVNKCINKRFENFNCDTPKRRRNMSSEKDQPVQSVSPLVCGVCQNRVEEHLWFEHIGNEHNYLAWEEGAQPLDITNEEKVFNFLTYTRKMFGRLECSYCGIRRTQVKSYINHLKNCANIELLAPDSLLYTENENQSESFSKSKNRDTDENKFVVCGVCHINLEDEKWIDHIGKEHFYMAWKKGEQELNVNDEQELNDHLYALTKEIDGLICSKCGIRRKYVKSFLTHIKHCAGLSDSLNTTLDDSSMIDFNDSSFLVKDADKIVKCGVCHKELEQKYWLNHIQIEHAYMAWKDGEQAVNFDDQQEVLQHLNEMNKKYNGLVCNKCGITRKYVKVYLSHIETCDSTFASNTSIKEDGKESYECAVCAEVVSPKDWKNHAMTKHYNVAWIVGDFPIDIKNPNSVENYLKEYRKHFKKLQCHKCGVSRVSIFGFYAHVIQCGKTEEEIDEFRNHCEICNSKYLCIYKNQHLQTHREQEYAKERKKLLETKLKWDPKDEYETATEGRQAAKRARNFIGKYQKFEYTCPTCGFGADEETELENHNCGEIAQKDFSDSDESAHLVSSSGDESDITEVDSNISASDTELTRDVMRKHGESRSFATRIRRIPFELKNAKAFLSQSAVDFREIHYTSDILYPHWRDCKYEIVAEDEIPTYMPPLEKSCKLLISQGDWKTLNRFEAVKENGGGYTVFAGGSVQGVSWASEGGAGGAAGHHFLAASCHGAADSPRLDCSLVYSHRNMLQIWDFGNLTSSIPKFVLGIAHNYGTVWSIDWCASGTRDILLEHSSAFLRLGLLAAACSNGSAYIFCVPYPSTIIDSGKVIYKLTPVAELRLCRGERKKFQATSISWSAQKGHSVVLVGYSDGTTAFYDLESDSPLLKEKEDGMDVFYPYHDERSHNTSVTGVSTLAGARCGRGARGVCAASSASPTGSESVRRAACAVRLRAHLPCSDALHTPHWPSALLAENDGIVSAAVNELDWWGWGQRLGAVAALAACGTCGALAAHGPPLLRLMTPHPAYSSLHKEPVAYINITPLAKKRTKQKTDELAVKLEPRTYDDAVKTYGVEFKYAKEFDKNQLQQINNKPKELCHERFPLSDVTSLAFNPSPKYHRRLAVATHAGIIFVITV